MIVIRLGFFLYFAYGIYETWYRLKDASGRAFTKGLFMLGTIYFLAFPFFVTFNWLFVEE